MFGKGVHCLMIFSYMPYTNLTCIPWRGEIYRMCKFERPTSRLSKVIVWQTDRQTRPKLYTTPLRGWPTT